MGACMVGERGSSLDTRSRDRRRRPRRVPGADETLSRVRLRGARELTVKNISADGALVEGESRLLPGTHIDVHVTTRRGRMLVRARVLRAAVHHLTAESVCYRVALAFDTAIEVTDGYAVPGEIASPEPERTGYPTGALH